MLLGLETLWLYILIAFVAGLLGAMTGGGGFITLPAILSTGLNPEVALGTNKMLAALTTASSAHVLMKKGLFDLKRWFIPMGITGIGSIIGVISVHITPSDFLKKVLAVVILMAALYSIFFEFKQKKIDDVKKSESIQSRLLFNILSGLLGFYSGFIGVGLGILWMPIIMAICPMTLLEASGVSRLMCFVSNSVAFMLFAILGKIDYLLGSVMGVAMAFGAYLGAHSALKCHSLLLKSFILIIAIIMASRLILSN